MKTPLKRLCLGLVLAVLFSPTTLGGEIEYTLTESVGLEFRDEVVTYALEFKQGAAVAASLRVRDGAGKVIAHQLADLKLYGTSQDVTSAKLHFIVDHLAPYQKLAYTLRYSPKPSPVDVPRTDITSIKIGEKRIVYTSGIQIICPDGSQQFDPPRPLEGCPPPIYRVSHPDELPILFRLVGKAPVASYSASLLVDGTIFKVVRVAYKTAAGGVYNVDVKLIAGRDVCLVDENYDLPEGTAMAMLAHNLYSAGGWAKPIASKNRDYRPSRKLRCFEGGDLRPDSMHTFTGRMTVFAGFFFRDVATWTGDAAPPGIGILTYAEMQDERYQFESSVRGITRNDPTVTSVGRRELADLKDGWTFRFDPNDVGLKNKYYAEDFDRGEWKPIDLVGGWTKYGYRAYSANKWGWYAINFELPADAEGMAAVLSFDGVDEIGWIYVNGKSVGMHDGWDEPFAIEVQPEVLRRGEKNLLVVRVKDTAYQAGIYAPVRLSLLDPNVPPVPSDFGTANLKMPLGKGSRKWGVAMGPASKNVNKYLPDFGHFDSEYSNYTHECLVQYAETPLDKYKDMHLEWQSKATFPHLLHDRAGLAGLVEKVGKHALFKQQIDDVNSGAILRYLATGDVVHLKNAGTGVDASLVRWMRYGGINGEWFPLLSKYVFETLGGALRYDVLAGAGAYTPEEEKQARTTLLFMAHKLADVNMYDRRFHRHLKDGAPMPKHTVQALDLVHAMAIGSVGVLFSDHPQAQAWRDLAVGALDTTLEKFATVDGAWRDAPSRQAWTLARVLPVAVALQRNGDRDFFADPRFAASFDYLAKIQTPLDPRVKRAHLPMLGDARADHLMRTDRAPVYALLADAAPYFREHNPELSARLMAAWQRAGAKLGDYYWYDLAFLDPDMEAKAGVPSSARIDGLGALMRSDQGDYLLLKAAGRPADACAMDEGGILWYGDAMPIIAAVGMRGTSQDNGLDAATGWLARLVSRNNSCVSFSGATLHPRLSGTLTAFKSTPLADYAAVRVERPDLPEPGAWTRHAIWIKPTGDAQHQYLILLDHIQAAAQSQWNLNLPIGQMSVSPAKGGGRLVRIGDKAEGAVSVFFASPRNADVSTSAKQLTLAASKTTHHYQTLSVGQAGGENRYYLTIMAVSKQAAAAPEFIVLEPGKVIEIRGADETYRLFASSNAFTYNKKGVRFTGKLALIRSAGKTHDLFLVDGELVVLDADR